jgi:Leucine rich repeat
VSCLSFHELRWLDLSSNSIESIATFTSCNGLETLNLNKNQLKSLPKKIETFGSLRFFSADDNQLESLPDFGRNKLEALSFRNNCLTEMPKDSKGNDAFFDGIKVLELGGNPIQDPPAEIKDKDIYEPNGGWLVWDSFMIEKSAMIKANFPNHDFSRDQHKYPSYINIKKCAGMDPVYIGSFILNPGAQDSAKKAAQALTSRLIQYGFKI